jgi:hypothetical protein
MPQIVCTPTHVRRSSLACTKEQAESLGIPLRVVTLDTHSKLDVAIDGADDVDPNLNLVKGGGGGDVGGLVGGLDGGLVGGLVGPLVGGDAGGIKDVLRHWINGKLLHPDACFAKAYIRNCFALAGNDVVAFIQLFLIAT